MINCAVLVIQRDQIQVTVLTEDDKSITEKWKRRSGINFDNARGNFEDEPAFGDNDNLVSALSDIITPAIEIANGLSETEER